MSKTETITGMKLALVDAFDRNGFGSLPMPEVAFNLDELSEEDFQALLAND